MVTAFAQRVLDGLGEGLADRAGALLPDLVDGLTGPLAEIAALAEPTDRGWPRAFDLDTTPQPAWLGRVTGTSVPGGLTLEEQRTYVRDRARWRRGTPRAIEAAVTALLAGTKRVELLERDGSPWRLTIRVYESELPAGADAAIIAAAAEHKPAGIVLNLVIATGASFGHMTAMHGPTFADEAAAFPTFADAINHVPEEGS